MPAPRLYKTEAIVLRQRRLGEADRIVTLYTPGHGKLDAKAKGVRRTTSRMGGHLQPLNRCLVQLAQGHTMEVVAGCQVLESFPGLRQDLGRLSRALYAAELVDRFVPERVGGMAVYRLLLDALRRLEGGGEVDTALRYFELRLLELSGFRPELDRCAACGGDLELGGSLFSPPMGGVVCRDCAGGAGGARPLSLNALKALRLLQRAPYQEVARLRIGPELALEVERHLRAYIVGVLERDVNAAAFIERLRREHHPVEV